MPVYLKDDKVLLVDGAVATDAACCCGVCCPPVKITFFDVTLPGCCIEVGGVSSTFVPCGVGVGCVDINQSAGWGNLFYTDRWASADPSGTSAEFQEAYFNPDCTDFFFSGGNVWTVQIGCNEGQFEGLALGWFVIAAGPAVYFAASGIADPTLLISNDCTCNGSQSVNTDLCSGDGGTALIEFSPSSPGCDSPLTTCCTPPGFSPPP